MTTKKQNTINDINPMGMMRAKQVLELVPFGRASLWKFCRTGQFPAPVKVSGGITAWRNQQVLDWLAAQGATNDGEAE